MEPVDIVDKCKVIYKPKGAALEYSHLAINLYHGCKFACRYCYAPAIARKQLAEWSADPYPKKDILAKIDRDAQKLAGDPRSILLCFTSDPYQTAESAKLTRSTLLILEKYNLTATVLTKSGITAERDFDILKRNGWEFGTSVSCITNRTKMQYEPHAAGVGSRVSAIRNAHVKGIKTWVSMEPVWDTVEALRLIESLSNSVDFWKIGKMNHRKLDINWVKFREDAIRLLDRLGAKYYIKKELANFRD